MPTDLERGTLKFLRETQSGVWARHQLLEEGLTDNDIERMLRRRELRAEHRGVYVDHTGPLTWRQREWAAVLACWPAALCDESAVPGLPSPLIHVALGLHRSLGSLPGVELHAKAHLDDRVDWKACPPRMRTDHAVVDVMSKRIGAADVAGAYAALASACFKATKPDRLERTLARRSRVTGRKLIAGMLDDLRTGACSVLERGYLHRVERRHGLPNGERQRPSTATGKLTKQDIRYQQFGVVVELQGRSIHDNPDSWDADARRELAELATTEALTAKVTYGLVFGEACATAAWIAQILRRQGGAGEFVQCPDCPRLNRA